MPLRDKILHAATELYAETGFRGTTTRQIAQRAGVNEVTLFRHFGSKTALLSEAIQCACERREPNLLPEAPRNVREELLQWARITWGGLWARRAVIRTALGEIEAHPELYPKDNSATACAGRELGTYLERCRAAGLVQPSLDVTAATATLMGTLFADALSRDVLPFVYRREPAQAVLAYVELFLQAISNQIATAPAGPRHDNQIATGPAAPSP
ncbi:MAG TPA: helix-turn-helix domain-containing protein [Gemmatimonadales bacterium]|jgi:AcrR family transcriptional regulator|nr:helix-turn-helix domain-containing protein [Gemmatimonadales bacterium]